MEFFYHFFVTKNLVPPDGTSVEGILIANPTIALDNGLIEAFEPTNSQPSLLLDVGILDDRPATGLDGKKFDGDISERH